jgi:hypothetical protein
VMSFFAMYLKYVLRKDAWNHCLEISARKPMLRI